MNNRVYLLRGLMDDTIVCTSIWKDIKSALSVAAASLREDPIEEYEIIEYEQLKDEDFELHSSWRIHCDLKSLPF